MSNPRQTGVEDKWLTVGQIADLKVIGSRPTARVFVRNHPDIETRKGKGIGGEREEHRIETFPEPIRTQLLAKLQGTPPPQDEYKQIRSQSLWRRMEQATDKQKRKAQRKAKCLFRVVELVASGVPRIDALKQAAEENGWRNWKTLYSWEDTVRDLPEQDWLPGLIDWRGGSQPNNTRLSNPCKKGWSMVA